MTLQPGTRLGSYEILAAIGAGGMGEVHRAHDTKLGRDVAIKALPDLFANDPERLARFQREAQVLASLNHPNIAAIYGLEDANGIRALVMELVEGPTLADRIGHGPIPIDEALPIAKQVANALEAAHEQGIIHRDLKPANVKIRDDGTVKVLDFGLAKALDPVASANDLSRAPTITSPAMMTGVGVILGTAAYMAPEQARGKAVDKRADVWAFGCLLFEMLTGRRAFGGDEVSDTLAFVITKDVEWDLLPPDASQSIRRLLRRCLEKDPRRRLRDIGDAYVELDDPLDSRATSPDDRAARRAWRRVAPWIAGAAVGGAVAAFVVWTAMRQSPQKPVSPERLTIDVPSSAPFSGAVGTRASAELSFSPDGTRLAYVALIGGTRMVYVRSLDQLDALPSRGTENAYNPFFSPDGEWIGFFAGNAGAVGSLKLKKVKASGGPALTICDAVTPSGATWGADQTIIFASGFRGASALLGTPTLQGERLFRVSAAGGAPTALTTPDVKQSETRHSWPQLLPGGKRVLFSVATGASNFEAGRIAVLSLESGKSSTVVEHGYHGRYVPTGHLVYMLAGNLMAVPFDLDRLTATGPPVPVVEGVAGSVGSGSASFAFSPTGFLVYASGSTIGAGPIVRSMVWVDRMGSEEPLGAPVRAYVVPRISPDGTRVALEMDDQDKDIWIWDVGQQTLTRLTFDPKRDLKPVWTPDGRRIVFASDRDGAFNLYWQPSDGTGQAERLTTSANNQLAESFSADGKRLLLRETTSAAANDLLVFRLEGDRKTTPLIATKFNELGAEVSPDGRWVAYQSDESGQPQVYVRPFPDVTGGRWQVSNSSGTRPMWSRDGRELFYLTSGRPTALMEVSVQPGAALRAAAPQKIIDWPYGPTFDVSPDGKRFLALKLPTARGISESSAPSPFVVVLNWFDELKRLVPTKR